ncbi:glycosyltransferase family 4 protein [Streptomyces sp. NPDC026589]|uniref:glycosyltransferase family 4 protein n=1 Tax=Streptomyces sp. NPDC026589 TaxID=3155609 RepID=UPI0034069356
MSEPRTALIFSREYPPNTVGGTSTVARNLAVGLAAEGWTVHVVTTDPNANDDRRTAHGSVTVHRAGTGTTYDSRSGLDGSALRSHRLLLRVAEKAVAEKAGVDAVLLPDLFCFPEARLLADRVGAPLVNILLQDFRAITPYDRGAHHVTSGVSGERAHLLAVEEKAVRASDHTVFISHALHQAMATYYPLDPDRVSVVHLGVDPEEIDAVLADPDRHLLPAGLPDDARRRPLLVACGRLVPVKGFATLVDALALLPDRPHLALVGVGPEEEALRARAREQGVADRVTLLGDVPRRRALAWMSVASVAVVPSLWESFGYVCAEMMALGRPVVASQVESLAELVPSPRYGYPVEVEGPIGARRMAPRHLADALALALGNVQEAETRGGNARRRIQNHFTNAAFAGAVAALSERLSDERR